MLGSAEETAAAARPLVAYTVGPPPPANARRLHLNEFRYGHPASVLAAAREPQAEEDLLTRYQAGPDPALLADLARYAGAPSARNVLAAPGSDEVLRAVIDTCGLRGHARLLMGAPGYTHFEHYARLRGLEVVPYFIGLGTAPADHAAALEYHADLLAAGCLVYLCSPNNPTGDLWAPGTVARLADAYPRALFLVDEAYTEFAAAAPEGPGAALAQADYAAALNALSAAGVAAARPNVVVARTMSKAFGLAALRIGYAVGAEATIAAVGVAVSPKALNPAAARVARAALREPAHYHWAAVLAQRESRRVVETLRCRGWWALDTPGNFYLVYAGDAAAVAAHCARSGVLVRDRDALPGLAGFVRLTAGTAGDSDAVLAAFAGVAPPLGPPPQALYTPKGAVAAVKTLMRRTLAAARAGGAEVWAQGGTLLGMLRHEPGGMIPWDDDGDLAYLIGPGGADPFAGLRPAFREAGLALQRNRTDAYWQVGTNGEGEAISPAHIDVFSYRAAAGPGPDGKPVYVLDDERFREEAPGSPQAHCNTRYGHDELFPLARGRRFYDLEIPVPAQGEKVLRRALGADFMGVARARAAAGGLETFALRDRSPA